MATNFQIVADIGGTNARFACAADAESRLQHVTTLKCADYPGVDDAIGAW